MFGVNHWEYSNYYNDYNYYYEMNERIYHQHMPSYASDNVQMDAYFERIKTVEQLKKFFTHHNFDLTLKKGFFKVTIFDGEKDVNFRDYKHICMKLDDQRDKTLTVILHKKTNESELTIHEKDMIFVTSKGKWIVSRYFLTKENLIKLIPHK